MPGKLNENLAIDTLYKPASRTATGTLYEGGGTTGQGLDTQGYDEVVFDVEVGSVTSGTTLDVAVYESADDNADNATAVTSASLTQITNSNENTSRRGYVRCADTKRYLWAQVTKGGTADAAVYGISAIRGRDHENPQSTTFDFEV